MCSEGRRYWDSSLEGVEVGVIGRHNTCILSISDYVRLDYLIRICLLCRASLYLYLSGPEFAFLVQFCSLGNCMQAVSPCSRGSFSLSTFDQLPFTDIFHLFRVSRIYIFCIQIIEHHPQPSICSAIAAEVSRDADFGSK